MEQRLPPSLWEIHFASSIENSEWLRQAQFILPVGDYPVEILGSKENQLLALDFLEKVNNSFKEITESYLSKISQDEHTQKQVKDIRKKFEALDQWLHWLRSRINHPENPAP